MGKRILTIESLLIFMLSTTTRDRDGTEESKRCEELKFGYMYLLMVRRAREGGEGSKVRLNEPQLFMVPLYLSSSKYIVVFIASLTH